MKEFVVSVDETTARVGCTQGHLVGVRNNGVESYFDIPYASNAGRFRLAAPPKKWSGFRDCTRPGPVFPQLASRLDFATGPNAQDVSMSEDAFRLNVFAPANGKNLPVIFWIHGGGFLNGGGSLPYYDGTNLARTGRAVIVTVNYRLGLLGNFLLDDISDGNLAVHDLVSALHWVHRNIRNFGGNPESIAIAGQSAGAWYTRLLMAMPMSAPLFQKAILLSMPGFAPQSKDAARGLSKLLCEIAGIDSNGQVIKDVPVELILDAQAELLRRRSTFGEVPMGFLPIADSMVPAEPTLDAVHQSAGKPVMIGWTKEETGSFFASNPEVVAVTKEQVLTKFAQVFGGDAQLQYEQASSRWRTPTPYKNLVDLSTEHLFKSPSLELANALSRAGSDVFTYQFNMRSPQANVLAGHCFELPFFFGNFDRWGDAPMLRGLDMQLARSISKKIRSYLLNFAESGNPNGSALPSWPKRRTESSRSMYFGQLISSYGYGRP